MALWRWSAIATFAASDMFGVLLVMCLFFGSVFMPLARFATPVAVQDQRTVRGMAVAAMVQSP